MAGPGRITLSLVGNTTRSTFVTTMADPHAFKAVPDTLTELREGSGSRPNHTHDRGYPVVLLPLLGSQTADPHLASNSQGNHTRACKWKCMHVQTHASAEAARPRSTGAVTGAGSAGYYPALAIPYDRLALAGAFQL